MLNTIRANWGRALCGGLLLLGIIAQEASAVPPFARKYKTSCATCHEAFPRLNSVGEAFRLNGYKFNDDEIYVKEEPIELGDEAYKKVWPKAIYPGGIPGTSPLSVQVTSDYEVELNDRDGVAASNQFVFPKEAKILGAAAFGENLSAFAEFKFTNAGVTSGHGGHGGAATDSVSTSIEGWLQFEDLLRHDNWLNLRIGTVGMHEMGLFTARDHNRWTVNPYLYSTWTMPEADHHETEHALEDTLGDEATFGQTNEYTIHAQPGVEINGFAKRWRYALGVVNGNGESVTDNNSQKDFYGQFAYKFFGLGFDGSGGKEGATLSDAESWRDDSLVLSFFGYSGTALVEITGDATTSSLNDDFYRAGVGLQWRIRDLQLGGGYVYGNNDNPYGALTSRDVESHSWYVEAAYFVYPWLIPNVRYEGLTLDLPNDVEAIQENQDRERIIAGVKIMPRANVSIAVEGRFYTQDERYTKATNRQDTGSEDQLVFSLSYAF